jgi:endonuclease/exonuclease/phosphatase family metal-dependent hydrolase
VNRVILLVVLSLVFSINAFSQKQVKVVAIGFYNVENFFDTLDDPNKKDEDFTPDGPYHNTGEVYRQKLHNIASVFAQMGTDMTPDGPAIIGLAELENDNVLKDLVAQPEISSRHYKYEWFYTPDERGISTAMLYNPKYFKVISSRPLHVPLESLGQTRPTRDILYVCGVLAGDTVHVLVNHWPSKSGGESASAPGRKLAAQVNRNIIDSILSVNIDAKVLVMGDLNDDPTSEAVLEVLGCKGDKKELSNKDLYNPWIKPYKNGLGSESFRGIWHLIDQIILSKAFVENKNNKWKYYSSQIFNKEFLKNKIGDDKGLPHRSYTISQRWDNGYSDHFPVLVYLVESVSK